jgi:(1->4)-alpha-D-glucan 1-alpha-D-glucosylmutase
VLAFDRGGAITVATRLPATLAGSGGWRDTSLELPPGRWVDALAGDGASVHADRARLADLLADLPVALLVREEE